MIVSGDMLSRCRQQQLACSETREPLGTVQNSNSSSEPTELSRCTSSQWERHKTSPIYY